MRLVTCITILLAGLATASPAFAQSAPLSGPPGASLNKVLVIGTDGTRWDLVQEAVRAGKAPNLARLQRKGFGRPALLNYAPSVFTLSEVGWSSMAAGVWPPKHGVDGSKFNMDPGQATKNGYLDFLTRIERERPSLSTFIASDWANIALPKNGGPIFGSAMDARYALDTTEETLAAWDGGDEQVTRAAERYLRQGDPDAGFVYLGVVDETAHLVGSATPAYAQSISTTDARIGRLLAAIRARPSFPFESWTVLVSTDHGQQPFDYPSIVSHLGQTPLELTSFVLGAGPGLRRAPGNPLVVDILPTVLHQLGVPVRSAWNIDGRTLSNRRPPSSAVAKLRGGRLKVKLRLGSKPRASVVSLRLPLGTTFRGRGRVRINGRAARALITPSGVSVFTGGQKVRRVVIRLDGILRRSPAGRQLSLYLRSGNQTTGRLSVPVG